MSPASYKWDSKSYEKNASFVFKYGEDLLPLLDPKQGENILDIGCGTGVLTKKIEQTGAKVIGIDPSEDMIESARKLGLKAYTGYAEYMNYDSEFDAVFSNATLHWIKDRESLIDAIYRSLKKSGRFVAEFGGKGNVNAVRSALHESLKKRGIDPLKIDPWYFPDKAEYKSLLEEKGFFVEFIELFNRPTLLDGDIEGWLNIFCKNFLNVISQEERDEFIKELVTALKPELCDSAGKWTIDYVRIRIKATKP
ncbi:MAG: class I SAM-dependent methyltransferase [bacterium]